MQGFCWATSPSNRTHGSSPLNGRVAPREKLKWRIGSAWPLLECKPSNMKDHWDDTLVVYFIFIYDYFCMLCLFVLHVLLCVCLCVSLIVSAYLCQLIKYIYVHSADYNPSYRYVDPFFRLVCLVCQKLHNTMLQELKPAVDCLHSSQNFSKFPIQISPPNVIRGWSLSHPHFWPVSSSVYQFITQIHPNHPQSVLARLILIPRLPFLPEAQCCSGYQSKLVKGVGRYQRMATLDIASIHMYIYIHIYTVYMCVCVYIYI